MNKPEYRLRIFDFLNCLSDILDWISPVLNDHHKQVALISLRIARVLKLDEAQVNEIVSAAILHDIGAISLAERMDSLRFENTAGQAHAEMGYFLLKIFAPMRRSAEIIRFHHYPWANGNGARYNDIAVPLGSRILYLADHIALLIDRDKEVLGQAAQIKIRVVEAGASMFEPKLVEAFLSLADCEYFWLDLVSPLIGKQLERCAKLDTILMQAQQLESFASLFRRIIDFRNPFTATHSSGVSATAECLGRLASFDELSCFELKVAGFLHDLGKLAIPTEILEKPGKLTDKEFNIIRAHTFYTYRVLEPIEDLYRINQYAAYHHERLDGSGYPFKLNELELNDGARLMAVADVFTALMEDRPYRSGMSLEQTMIIIDKLAINNKLDAKFVELLKDNLEQVNAVRAKAQITSREEYRSFVTELGSSEVEFKQFRLP